MSPVFDSGELSLNINFIIGGRIENYKENIRKRGCSGYFDFDKNAPVLIRFPTPMYMQKFLSKICSYLPHLSESSIRREFRHAFSMGTAHKNRELAEPELALIQKLVIIVKKRRLTVPSTLFLECTQPLSYLGSQMMVFFRPFLTFFFTPAEYDLLQGILEKREGIKRIIEELEKSNTHRKDAKVVEDDSK